MVSYNDSEVKVFHPLCESALEYALRMTGHDQNYKVVHHKHTGALEMDFVIENIMTGKYLCVVEVKRTPTAVSSTRHQYQAMSYVQMNAGMTEKPFYILTNLEKAIAFRYDALKPRVFQQMLMPGVVNIADFSSLSTDDDLVTALGDYFKDVLVNFLNNKFDYFLTLEDFAEAMEMVKDNRRQWKSNLAVMLYEYIRGAFNQVSRGGDLHDIRIFHDNVEQICNEAARIDFKGIFQYSAASFASTAVVPNNLLVNLFDYGNRNITGDAVAGILHQIVSAGNEHDGEVPTDLELARLAAILAHDVSGDMEEGEYICDPAAGSGNLISSAIQPYHLTPHQIKANDCNEQLLELLSLRLGLHYANGICLTNAPEITCEDITDIDISYFAGVKVIVMNPPYVAGIYCVERKQPFFRRIRELSGTDPLTEIGQMPLEAVFLELICELAAEGTTIACVFPKAHLTARGEEARIIRQLLLEKFGLKTIFAYPGEGIFENVVKDTCVIVGTIKRRNGDIKVISSYEEIGNIDFTRFEIVIQDVMTANFAEIMSGISGKIITYESLQLNISDGWRELDIEMEDALKYVNDNLMPSIKLIQLEQYNYPIKRGEAANKGGSDLLFFDSEEELYRTFADRVVLCAGMRNAKTIDTIDIEGGDSKFLNISFNTEIIDDIIDVYMNFAESSDKQTRQEKTKDEWRDILEYESRGGFAANSVLIPRAIRTDGRAFLSSQEVFVSTNFIVWTLPDDEKALLASTWMTTVFYQLICETSSTDREGMRKMEVADIKLTLVPNFDNISKDIILKLKLEKNNIEFLKLNHPIIRNVDRIWAEELFGENADFQLQKAIRLLRYLSNKRNRK